MANYAESEVIPELVAAESARRFTPVHSGKVREILRSDGEELLLVATDRISAFDVVMAERVPGKGKVLNKLSEYWFRHLEKQAGIPNHIINPNYLPGGEFDDRAMLVQRTEPIMTECIVRGVLTGSFLKAYQATEPNPDGTRTVLGITLPGDMQESQPFPEPLFTPSTKAGDGEHDVNLTEAETRARLVEQVGYDCFDELGEMAVDLYLAAYKHARESGIIIADTKLEFGLHNGRIILIDEVFTPDSSRFVFAEDYKVGEPLKSRDKQILRYYLDSIGWDRDPSNPPALPGELIAEIAETYRVMYRRITGEEIAA